MRVYKPELTKQIRLLFAEVAESTHGDFTVEIPAFPKFKHGDKVQVLKNANGLEFENGVKLIAMVSNVTTNFHNTKYAYELIFTLFGTAWTIWPEHSVFNEEYLEEYTKTSNVPTNNNQM